MLAGRSIGESFVWIAGTDVGAPLASPSYSNFNSGEPNLGESYFCIEMSGSGAGEWSSNQCTVSRGFVVEFEPFSHSWPAKDLFVINGSNAFQLLPAPQLFSSALTLSPHPTIPLGAHFLSFRVSNETSWI
jgi:hypothetical protein